MAHMKRVLDERTAEDVSDGIMFDCLLFGPLISVLSSRPVSVSVCVCVCWIMLLCGACSSFCAHTSFAYTSPYAQVAVMAAVGPLFGLSRLASIRTGLLLAPGGEFAFVAFGEAVARGVLPASVCNLLYVVRLPVWLSSVSGRSGTGVASRVC